MMFIHHESGKISKLQKVPNGALSGYSQMVLGATKRLSFVFLLVSVLGMILLTFSGCSVYTFSGSTLPSHLKSVDIPQFTNQTLEPNVAEQVTTQLNQEVLSTNILRIVSQSGDATIVGKITGYSNTPYTFSAASTRQVDVNQYIVRINAEVEFTDNKKGESLYKGTINGEGIYDFNSGSQNELTGRQKAIKQLVERILQNSVQSW